MKLSGSVKKQVESFGICDKCGEAVPKSQVKFSHLFMSKTLCKDCMDASNTHFPSHFKRLGVKDLI